MTRKAARAGLDNLRAIRIESGYFLKYLMPPNSVAALHIYFPDPWPKRKHRDNRLVNDGFPALARAVLEMEGTVYLRTDDADYFASNTFVVSSPNWLMTRTAIFWPFFIGKGWLLFP